MGTDSVQTVRGPVALDDLGRTLMHEHVFVLTPDVMINYGDGWWDEEERVADAVTKLQALKDSGIDTIVDPTVVGLGRDIPRVQRVNDQVDINIIAATGLYTFDEIPHYFHYRGPGGLFGGAEPMTKLFISDLTTGIGETGVKAAFLKGVVEERGMTPDQERVHESICAAHAETGAPITVHTNSAAHTGLVVIDFYRERGVDLAKVVIGHAGDSNDLDYLRKLLDSGATIGCDRFGLDIFNPTDQRVATVATLCAQGYAEQIVLAHDASCYMDFFSGEETQAQLQATVPNWNFQHIPRDVLPALAAAGVTDDQIETMLVRNPARYFTVAR